MEEERRQRYANVLSCAIAPGRIAVGKILVCAGFLLLSCAISALLSALCSRLIYGWKELRISWQGGAMLAIAYLWRIPLAMLLAAKAGMFALVAVDLPLSVASGLIADRANIFPFSLPGKILLSEGHPHWSYIPLEDRPYLPAFDVALALGLFLALALLLISWLNGREVQ